jgi:hypothetical protein
LITRAPQVGELPGGERRGYRLLERDHGDAVEGVSHGAFFSVGSRDYACATAHVR